MKANRQNTRGLSLLTATVNTKRAARVPNSSDADCLDIETREPWSLPHVPLLARGFLHIFFLLWIAAAMSVSKILARAGGSLRKKETAWFRSVVSPLSIVRAACPRTWGRSMRRSALSRPLAWRL